MLLQLLYDIHTRMYTMLYNVVQSYWLERTSGAALRRPFASATVVHFRVSGQKLRPMHESWACRRSMGDAFTKHHHVGAAPLI